MPLHITPPAVRRNKTEVCRLALSKAEAAQALGVSVDFFERHVMTDLRIVRCGRRRLIPVSALETWLEAHASKVLERTAAAHTRQSVNGRADSPTAVLVHTPPKPS